MSTVPLRRRAMRLAAIAVCAAGPLAAQALGPKDGPSVPAEDTSRVAVGALAPDFTLESLAGPRVTLSEFRGSKTVVLVFYRGHW